jgi:hypothetical protein
MPVRLSHHAGIAGVGVGALVGVVVAFGLHSPPKAPQALPSAQVADRGAAPAVARAPTLTPARWAGVARAQQQRTAAVRLRRAQQQRRARTRAERRIAHERAAAQASARTAAAAQPVVTQPTSSTVAAPITQTSTSQPSIQRTAVPTHTAAPSAKPASKKPAKTAGASFDDSG